jgi:hypothetical protein
MLPIGSRSALNPVFPPKLVALARDIYLKPKIIIADPVHLMSAPTPAYGQDVTSGYGRMAPRTQSVGATPEVLKPKMQRLLSEFAAGDKSHMAKRLFDAFLKNTCRRVTYFDDAALNAAAARHPNVQVFCSGALSAPNSPHRSGRTRIHQALKNAQWDITKIVAPTDLGVPAFNQGSKAFGTKDFDNGLGLMINGVQYVYILATHYQYDAATGKYAVKLKFIFYDVFGLDDDDLAEFGATSDSMFLPKQVGITAWWQLQHQHGCTPLITRIIFERMYEAPAQ